MQRRRLGSSDLEVSVLGLGTRAMGGETDAGLADDNECIATIERAVALGVNLIATSPVYGDGRAEQIVGKAVAEYRQHVLLATQCGVAAARVGMAPATRRLTRDLVIRECEASLRRLQTDYIDLYLCHFPDPAAPMSAPFDGLRLLLEQGKIRALGLAGHGCEEVAAAIGCGPVAAVAAPFSLFQRRAGEDLLPFCAARNIGVLALTPLARGLLTGKYSSDGRIKAVRAADSEFQGPRFQRNLERVAGLSAIATRYGRTVAQLALRWVVAQTGVTCAVAGARRPSQIEENAGAADWSIAPDDLAEIDNLLAGG